MESFKIVQELEKSIASLKPEILRHTLAYLLKVYVIDKGPVGGAGLSLNSGDSASRDPLRQSYENFTQLMTALKRSFTLEELNLFTIEGGKVYITLENKRYQISAESPARDTPLSSPRANTPENPGQSLPPTPDPGRGNRFSNLEMD